MMPKVVWGPGANIFDPEMPIGFELHFRFWDEVFMRFHVEGLDDFWNRRITRQIDGVTFPAAEVPLEFMDPAAEEEGAGGAMFPTGHIVDDLEVPGIGTFKATMINAGIPTIFINADALGYTGTELQDAINSDDRALARFETIRAHGALRMGLIKHLDEIATRQHTPKLAFVAKPADYVASSGKAVRAADVDLLVRAMSMGKLHHAMMGTAAVAIGTAAAISGTLVNLAAGGGERESVRFWSGLLADRS